MYFSYDLIFTLPTQDLVENFGVKSFVNSSVLWSPSGDWFVKPKHDHYLLWYDLRYTRLLVYAQSYSDRDNRLNENCCMAKTNIQQLEVLNQLW